MTPHDLRLLVFPETGGHWTARALEHDVAVQARTLENAVDAVVKIMRAHAEFDRRHNRVPLSGFAPAPRLYWTAFRTACQAAAAREVEIGDADWMPRFIIVVADRAPAAFKLSLTA